MRSLAILLTCVVLSACGEDRRNPTTPGAEGGDDGQGDGADGDDDGGVAGNGTGGDDGGQQGGDGGDGGEGEGEPGGGDDGPTPAFCGPFDDRPPAPDDDPPLDDNPPVCEGGCTGRTRCVHPGECVNTCEASIECPISVMRTVIRADGSTFKIDAYEASRPDAGETQPGCNQRGRACSQADVHPWTDVTWHEADAGCKKVFKRLCTMEEWQAACKSSCGFKYPYGDDFDGAACNGSGANPEGATFWETGRRAKCSSPDWVYDLVGNAREWTSTETEPDVYAIVGGSPRDQARSILSCAGEDIKTEGPGNAPDFVGFRCCTD